MIDKKAHAYKPVVGDYIQFPTNLHHKPDWDKGKIVEVYTPTHVLVRVGDIDIHMRNNEVDFLKKGKAYKKRENKKKSKFQIWKEELESKVVIPEVVDDKFLKKFYKRRTPIPILVKVFSE